MIVCPEFKLCFLYTPETGGEAVQEVLAPHAFLDLSRLPMQYQTNRPGSAPVTDEEKLRRRFGLGWCHVSELASSYENNERFFRTDSGKQHVCAAVVRNPWERMVAMYKTLPDGSDSFDEYLRRWPKTETSRVMVPFQTDHLWPENNDQHAALRSEFLQEDFDALCERVGMPKVELNLRDRSRPAFQGWNYQEKAYAPVQEFPWQAAYSSQERIDRVFHLCTDDIERFGYEAPEVWERHVA